VSIVHVVMDEVSTNGRFFFGEKRRRVVTSELRDGRDNRTDMVAMSRRSCNALSTKRRR